MSRSRDPSFMVFPSRQKRSMFFHCAQFSGHSSFFFYAKSIRPTTRVRIVGTREINWPPLLVARETIPRINGYILIVFHCTNEIDRDAATYSPETLYKGNFFIERLVLLVKDDIVKGHRLNLKATNDGASFSSASQNCFEFKTIKQIFSPFSISISVTMTQLMQSPSDNESDCLRGEPTKEEILIRTGLCSVDELSCIM